jgi:hypothetical protein
VLGRAAFRDQIAKVGFDGSGRAVAVWRSDDGQKWSIAARRFVPGTGWEAPVEIASPGVGAGFLELAVAPDGAAHSVWLQTDVGDDLTVFGNRFEPASGWGTPGRIDQGAGWAADATVAVDPQGNAVAAWAQSARPRDGGPYDVRASHFAPDTGWSLPVTLDQAGQDARYPRAAIEAGGTATVVWRQDGGGPTFWASRFE